VNDDVMSTGRLSAVEVVMASRISTT